MRTFAEDLRGTFYRCPKCREGVIAVPEEGWAEPSDEAPGVREALREPHPSRRMQSSSDDGGSSADGSSASTEAIEARRKKPPSDETPRGAFFGTGAHAASSSADDSKDDGPDFVDPRDPKKAAVGSGDRRPVKVRRILVECALCGYHVAVPPELFGKTVHCPECRADMMFSESSLEPVKDEIIGRIALEHAERRALENPIGAPILSPDAILRAHRRRAVVIVLVLAALAGGLFALLWKIVLQK